jgi:hypothetical protein
MKIKTARDRRSAPPGFLLAALVLSLLPVSRARSAAVEADVRTGGEVALPAPILSAMSVQLTAMTPLLATPQAMGQMLARQALAPGGMTAITNNVAAALVIKQALTDPAAAAAVQKTLAAQSDPVGRQVSRNLTVLRQSLIDRPEALSSFERTMQPLARFQTDNKDVKETLDSIFSGSDKRGGEPSADPVLAQNATGSPKIRLSLQPAPKGALRRAAELAGAAAVLSGVVTQEGHAAAHAVFNETPAAGKAAANAGVPVAANAAVDKAPSSLQPFIDQMNDDYYNAHGFAPGEAPSGLSKGQKIGLSVIGSTLLASAFGVQGLITEAALAALIVGFFLVRRVTFRSKYTGGDMAGAALGQVLRLGGAAVLLAQIARLFAH